MNIDFFKNKIRIDSFIEKLEAHLIRIVAKTSTERGFIYDLRYIYKFSLIGYNRVKKITLRLLH